MKIINGDIFTSNANMILHQVNCFGVMGSGVAKQVKEKYPEVYEKYRQMCELNRDNLTALMGYAHICRTNTGRYIGNLFGQFDFGSNKNKVYTDYDALRKCLKTIKVFSKTNHVKIAIPYNMGCTRGGGDWDIVYSIIETELSGCDVEIWRLDNG